MKLCCSVSLFFISLLFASESPKLFFLSIPKTGSGTATQLCSQHYLVEEIQGIGWRHISEEKMVEMIDGKKMIHGHVLYSQVRKYLDGFTKVTFLRDPVERVLSEHRYLLEANNRHKESHFLPGEGDPIETAENNVCLMLSCLDPFDPRIPIETHLQSAKEALLEFDLIGLTEEISSSLEQIHSKFGWEMPSFIPCYNATIKEERPSLELIQEIQRRNWADIELYAFAKDLFEKQKTQLPLQEALPDRAVWVDRVDYHFGMPLENGFGWDPRSRCEIGLFRWVDSMEKASLYFHLLPRRYSIVIEACISNQLEKETNFYVNGHLLCVKKIKIPHERKSPSSKPHQRTPKRYSWYRCEGEIPRDWIVSGEKTEVQFTIPRSGAKQESLPFQRGRLGVASVVIH